MAKEIRVTEYYSASIANSIAEGARVLGALRDVGLNLIAFWGYKHGGGGQPHFCCGRKANQAQAGQSTALMRNPSNPRGQAVTRALPLIP